MTKSITKPLIFIVGAGASKDFGKSMPVGSELASRIQAALDSEFSLGDRSGGPIKKALRHARVAPWKELVEAVDQIRDAIVFHPSIDDLLHGWRDKPAMLRVAKMTIAQKILSAEAHSTLGKICDSRDAARHAIRSLTTSWLHVLMTRLGGTTHRRQVDRLFDKVGFIVFNYDRCIEQYLYWAFQLVSGRTPATAAELVLQIPIHHVYGDLGTLPFDKSGTRAVGFGDESKLSSAVAERIRTYTEDNESGHLRAIHSLVLGAKRIVFLGCAYHQQNLDLLFSAGAPKECRVWGTAHNPDPLRLQAVQSISATASSTRLRANVAQGVHGLPERAALQGILLRE